MKATSTLDPGKGGHGASDLVHLTPGEIRVKQKFVSSSNSHVLYTCVRRDGVQDLTALCWIDTPGTVERVLLRTQGSCVCVCVRACARVRECV